MTRFVSIAVITLLATACSPRLEPFTAELRNKLNYSERQLSQVQFYLSHDIVLHRGTSASKSKVEGGKIKVVDGSSVEEIVFPAGTPGVLVNESSSERLAVSFDDDSKDVLFFGPVKNSAGRYVILAKDWSQRKGTISYKGKDYFIDSQSSYASLMVDIKKARKATRKTQNVQGRRVD